jgi:hypothetical protein
MTNASLAPYHGYIHRIRVCNRSANTPHGWLNGRWSSLKCPFPPKVREVVRLLVDDIEEETLTLHHSAPQSPNQLHLDVVQRWSSPPVPTLRAIGREEEC